MHVSFSFTQKAQTDFKHTHRFPFSNYCVQRLNSQEKAIPRLIFVCSRSLLPERPPLKSILSIKRDTTAMNASRNITRLAFKSVSRRNFNWDQPFFCFLLRKTEIDFIKRVNKGRKADVGAKG